MKKIWKIIAIAIAVVTLGVVGISAFGGGMSLGRDVNPDNLIVEKNYFNNLLDESDGGLKVNWKDDGTFVLYGKHEDKSLADAALFKSDFTSVTLEAGTYTISTGNDHADQEKFGLYVQYGSNIEYVTDEHVTFTLTEDTVVIVGFFVKNNYTCLFHKIAPVLVEGSEAAEFYK